MSTTDRDNGRASEFGAGLRLADGGAMWVRGQDPAASVVVGRLRDIMRLAETPCPGPGIEVRVSSAAAEGSGRSLRDGWCPMRVSGPADATTAILVGAGDERELTAHVMGIGALMCRPVEDRGGLLVHGALVEQGGWGVVLAGPGESGKTTACRRLPATWRVLSDDACLIVRMPDGSCCAHPWPTWSRFMFGGHGGAWEVQRAVPLAGVFALRQSAVDRCARLSRAEAVAMLVQSSEEAWHPLRCVGAETDVRARRRQRFDSACALAATVPCHVLQLTMHGAFWEPITSALDRRALP